MVLGQNPPEIAYWERGDWWLAGDARPWQPDAVNIERERRTDPHVGGADSLAGGSAFARPSLGWRAALTRATGAALVVWGVVTLVSINQKVERNPARGSRSGPPLPSRLCGRRE